MTHNPTVQSGKHVFAHQQSMGKAMIPGPAGDIVDYPGIIVNKIENQFQLLGQILQWQPMATSQRVFNMDLNQLTFGPLPSRSENADTVYVQRDPSKVIAVTLPYYSVGDKIDNETIQGKRSMHNVFEPLQLEEVEGRSMIKLRGCMERTMELLRVGALKGIVKDVNDKIHFDSYRTFGVKGSIHLKRLTKKELLTGGFGTLANTATHFSSTGPDGVLEDAGLKAAFPGLVNAKTGAAVTLSSDGVTVAGLDPAAGGGVEFDPDNVVLRYDGPALFDLDTNPAGNINAQLHRIRIHLSRQLLSGQGFGNVGYICSQDFVENLIAHPDVARTYIRDQSPANPYKQFDPTAQAFVHQSAIFHSYTGYIRNDAGTPARDYIEPGWAYAFPQGIQDMWHVAYGPADRLSSANQPGQEIFVFSYRDPRDRYMEVCMESSPLFWNQYPQSIVKVKLGTTDLGSAI